MLHYEAHGHENSPHVLMEFVEASDRPLEMLFKYSMKQRPMIMEWSRANVLPIFTKGDAANALNYWPVSLMNVVSKMLEKII